METRLVYARAVAGIGEKDVPQIPEHLANDTASLDRNELKDFLRGRIGKVTMKQETLNCRIHYIIPAATGELTASPRALLGSRIASATASALRARRSDAAASNPTSTGRRVVEPRGSNPTWESQIKTPPRGWRFYLASPRGFEPRLPP